MRKSGARLIEKFSVGSMQFVERFTLRTLSPNPLTGGVGAQLADREIARLNDTAGQAMLFATHKLSHMPTHEVFSLRPNSGSFKRSFCPPNLFLSNVKCLLVKSSHQKQQI